MDGGPGPVRGTGGAGAGPFPRRRPPRPGPPSGTSPALRRPDAVSEHHPGVRRSALPGGRAHREADPPDRAVERGGRGLSIYPHPRLMPEFWEYPTVSMGLGPLAAIYQARFNRYLRDRGIKDTSASRVWCFLGDGETDEPEAL